jgi:shikimate dehydrogenase
MKTVSLFDSPDKHPERTRFCILGKPVGHSKSPAMFRAAYSGFPDLKYDSSELNSAEECVELLKSRYDGGNITAPFKEGVFRLADETSETANIIGAVNTVIVSRNRIIADNCDHYGVSESFREFNVSLKGKSCLLLGIGGAGKAAAYAVNQAGGRLTIVNRTVGKAEDFAEKLNCNAASLNDLGSLMKTGEVIINTLYSEIDVVDKNMLNPDQIILDASYIGSPLLKKAKELNCLTVDGRYWVYHQAVYCFYKFTGLKPDTEAMRKEIFK